MREVYSKRIRYDDLYTNFVSTNPIQKQWLEIEGDGTGCIGSIF